MRIHRFSEFVGEAVRAAKMTNAHDALLSLLPPDYQDSEWYGEPPVGRRMVCYFTWADLNHPDLGKKAMLEKDRLMMLGFKLVSVKGVNGAMIMFHPDAEAQAMELKAIAERYGGFLSYKATEEDARRIGELLEYHPQDIEDFIRKNYGPVTESRDWAVWLALAAALGGAPGARAGSGQDMRQVVDTVRRKTTRADYMPEFEKARERVKAKVESSPIITNKEELIQRLDSVEVREYSAMSTTMMYYLQDPVGQKDYIFVNLKVYRPEIAIGTFVHELSHLVDKRERVSVDIPANQVFLSPSYVEYREWFADWPPLEWIRGKERKPMSVGKLLANSVSGMRGYMNQSHEQYARLSSLKDYLIRQGWMRQGDRLEKRHVDRMIVWAKGLKGREYYQFLENDFVLILPMIDWRCLDEINMIAARPGPDNSSEA